MTFEDIQDEVIGSRFKEGQRESIKRWVNLRYHFIWGVADWPWKRMGPVSLAIGTGDSTPTLPTDFERPLAIYDDQGTEIKFMAPDDFDREYRWATINGTTYRPQAFKWVNQTITLGPLPDADYTFALTYERKASILFNGVTEQAGQLVNPNDEPIWAEQYHWVLVMGAIAEGLRIENDPTYPQFEDSYEAIIASMSDHYLPTMNPVGNTQYGADDL